MHLSTTDHMVSLPCVLEKKKDVKTDNVIVTKQNCGAGNYLYIKKKTLFSTLYKDFTSPGRWFGPEITQLDFKHH